MRVHYDNIVFSLQRAGGISTYWSELITRLLRDEIEIAFEEFSQENIVRSQLAIPNHSVHLSSSKYLLLQRFRTIPLPGRLESFVFHSSYHRLTSNPYARQVTTVHDFVHEKFYGGVRRKLHLMQKKKVLKAADQVIAVSEHTKKDLLEYHPYLLPENIRVIYNGVSTDFYPLAEPQKAEVDLPSSRPYLLFVGSREHYKNFSFTADLLSACPQFELYIVGSLLTKQETQYLNRQLAGRWKHFHHISNKRLNELYNCAFALIYPSLYEGFGIPLLEAMKAGTPFLALRSSSIPEVAGAAGMLLEKPDIGLFQQALEIIEQQRELMVEEGFIQASRFSWETCYQQTLQVYKELMSV